MERNNQVIRVLKILYLLLGSRAGSTIKGLARDFKVHPKTIRRDLQAIYKSDFTLISFKERGNKYYTTKEGLTKQSLL